MNVLVVGATGYLGSEVCRRLRERGHEVRALVRPTSEPERVAALRDLGCVPVAGDLKEEVSVGAACAGMQVVVSTATTTRSRQAGEGLESVDRDGQAALVEAAKAAGVERFVYVSFSGNIGEDDPLTLAKRGTEARVRESGMTWCVLRPSCFMEAWLSPELGFDYPNATATIFGDGTGELSWISLGDVAEFAARAVDDPAAADAVLELGGPEALSQLDVVRIFEEVGGRPFTLQHVPEAALRARAAAATDTMEQAFAALMLAVARGDRIPMEGVLETFPVRLTSVRDYARRVVQLSA